MAVATNTAISSQTAAANSATITVDAGVIIQVYCDPKLANNETVGLERTFDSGTTWVSVNPPGGGELLSGRVNSNTVVGPGVFRLAKSATTTATAVYYDA